MKMKAYIYYGITMKDLYVSTFSNLENEISILLGEKEIEICDSYITSLQTNLDQVLSNHKESLLKNNITRAEVHLNYLKQLPVNTDGL